MTYKAGDMQERHLDLITLRKARGLVLEQAEDEALWFEAEYASEAYLQQALRDLHHALEDRAT